ncbi:MAG: DUF2796 domain-containing protein [Hyphomicrobiales bacterium]
MIRTALIGVAGLMMVATPIAAQTDRQLEAHEHGHGILKMAVEDRTLHIEFEVPGSDVVGLEHVATTEADKELIETAKETLSQPAKLFVLSAEADCKVVSASVKLLEGETEPAEDDDHAHEEHDQENDHTGHSEFRAQYSFSCDRIDAVTSVAFPYFDLFPNARELAVTLITDKGQVAFEVTRSNAIIHVQGMI